MYRNTLQCIVTGGSRLWQALCRDTAGRPGHDTVLAHAALGHDTATGPVTRRAGAQGKARRGVGHGTCDTTRRGACCDKVARPTTRPVRSG